MDGNSSRQQASHHTASAANHGPPYRQLLGMYEKAPVGFVTAAANCSTKASDDDRVPGTASCPVGFWVVYRGRYANVM